MQDQFTQNGKLSQPMALIISELQVGSAVNGWLLAVDVQHRTTVNGKPFLDLKLRDQKGSEITARQFDLPAADALTPLDNRVILLEGQVEKFRNQVQLRLSRSKIDETAPVELFTPGTRNPLAQIETTFQQLISKIDHVGLHTLVQRCFSTEVMAQFRRWPAAVRHHGAVTGGLLEHTVNVTLISDRLAQLYPCDQNLVLSGALLHDIGKLEEMEEQIGAGYTQMGRMVGHIVQGMQYVQKKAQSIDELSESTLHDLLHIILAHHTKEFGSPVNPATIEARIVHQADATEAQLTSFIEHCERTAGVDGWSAYSQVFGGQLRLSV